MQNLSNLVPWPTLDLHHHTPIPSSSTSTRTTLPMMSIPRLILTVRDTVNLNAIFSVYHFVKQFAIISSDSTSISNAKIIWIGGTTATESNVLAILNKNNLSAGTGELFKYLKYFNVIKEFGELILSDVQEGGDAAIDLEGYLKSLYERVKSEITASSGSSSNVIIVIDDCSSLSALFGENIFGSFISYITTTSKSSSSPNSTSVLLRVNADAVLNNLTSTSSTSTLQNVSSLRAGSKDCKWLGLGGIVGSTLDEQGSAYDEHLDSGGGYQAGGRSSTRGDYTPQTLFGGNQGMCARSADIICDVTELPSGFSREAHGSLNLWSVEGGRGWSCGSSKGGNADYGNLTINYQVIEGIVRGVRLR